MAEDKLKEIAKLKANYEDYRKKYGLPSYKELNEEFEIEKLTEAEGTELFMRKLRRVLIDKIIYLLRFLESFLNPQNAPMFILVILKNLKEGTGKVVEKLYKEGCDLEIKALTLDVSSTEKQEAELAKEIIKRWGSMKKEIEDLYKEVARAWEVSEKKEIKDYLG